MVDFDRWNLVVIPNDEVANTGDGEAKPPLAVINNYFSIGADAQTALAFHRAREKNPDRFNSRIANKLYYGLKGAVDMFAHSQKHIPRCVQLQVRDWCAPCGVLPRVGNPGAGSVLATIGSRQCDGQDMTHIVVEQKLEGIIFLNIPRYAAQRERSATVRLTRRRRQLCERHEPVGRWQRRRWHVPAAGHR